MTAEPAHGHPTAPSQCRVMLDVNVWSYIAEQGQAESFVDLERKLGLETVVPPSMLLEALYTRDPAQRNRLIRALTVPVRIHPKTEAQMQGREVVDEIRRLRPDWLQKMPDTSAIPSLEKWWTRKVWQWARESPDAAHRAILGNDEYARDHLLTVQDANKASFEEHRKAARHAGENPFRPEAVDDSWVTFTEEAPDEVLDGWEGDRVEAWRIEVALVYWNALVTILRRARRTGEDTTLADWVEPWVRRDRLARERSSWNRLWYYEAQASNMPYNWLHWAVYSAQLIGKAGKKAPGNPVDAQHCAYLPEVDVFLTADQRLGRVLADVIPRAPVKLGATLVVRHADPIVREVEQELVAWLGADGSS